MKIFTIIKWGLGAFSVLVGVFSFLYFYVAYWNVSETQKWPQVSAVVEETTVTREERSKGVTYCPKSIVRFQLNGTPHTAELQTSGFVCSRSENSARQTAGDWPRGKEVQIHANPAKPTQVRSVGFALGVADYLVLFVGCACFLLLLPLRHLKAKSAAAK
ncbi:DUF3592 domain-containing protein [Acidovorax sp. JG5]|jgi:hypothetical protein|uniref:DUF3592 domain-containing protein n=1 Tax=Acidovorax sp. JG5 TaxID=2822718 RepID=UPI001B33F3DA|nr:DUF3592 domain-containing protein [Acidovorax sp. JG5]MBP3981480.1 DUF3592 domain-containing protein [Acidovorax sp. JG5]